MRAARATRLFFLIQPITSLFYGVVVAIAVVLAEVPCHQNQVNMQNMLLSIEMMIQMMIP